MKKYIALLRGINIGGNKKVPMKELKSTFEQIGFKNVKTLLNSGNVVFEGEEKDLNNIEINLEKKFGFKIQAITLKSEELKKIIEENIFKNEEITPKNHAYITFSKEIKNPNPELPYLTQDKSFKIIKLKDNAIFSVLNLEKSGTTDAMKILEKLFGKEITTRNYNTIKKLGEF